MSSHRKLASATLGAIGIVYGDIGTSPLYALSQIFFGPARLTPDRATVLGGISLVIWTLTIIVSLKYALLVLRADNDGEGGLFALFGLLSGAEHRKSGRLLLLGLIVGAGLLFGDGIITPAISVLSAVEGLAVAEPDMAAVILPITVALLTLLFALQARGTASVGKIFGPILIVWFLIIAALGIKAILAEPDVLLAFNPLWAVRFLLDGSLNSNLLTLGAVMLCVTGGEAMYADLGHFGARSIRLGWFALVFPALILNYLGQGAFQLAHPVSGGQNLFYGMVPRAELFPMVILATLATIIASQSLISGAFSLMTQAVRLGLFPRLNIVHTHAEHNGQIYIGFVNWSLYLGCVVLACTFGSSSRLAAAYGLAVSGVMVITSLAMFPIARQRWHWSPRRALLVWGPLGLLNGAFLVASSFKFLEGGYVPVGIGLVVFVIMITWRWGRQATSAAYTRKHTMSIAELVELHRNSTQFLDRNAVLMIPRAPHTLHDHTPVLLQLLWDRYGVVPRNLIFVTVKHPRVPYVHDSRYRITAFEQSPDRGGIISVDINFGFMEEPNVENLLEELAQQKEIALPTDRRSWTVHVVHEHLLPAHGMTAMRRLRLMLFQFLRTVSQPSYYYYGMGARVQLSAEIMPVHVR